MVGEDYLIGVGEVAVDVQLELGLRQLLLDGDTADWADLELLLLLLGDLIDGGGSDAALWLLLLDLDWLLQQLDLDLLLLLLLLELLLELLLLLLLLVLLLLWGAQSQGGQLGLQLVQELLDSLQGWLLLADLLDLDRDQRLLDVRGHGWQRLVLALLLLLLLLLRLEWEVAEDLDLTLN